MYSANILLDERLQPKLTDFGMARLRPHSVNQSCTITMKTSIHGNLGYLPEEYIRDGKLSVKLDVYSFGMVGTNMGPFILWYCSIVDQVGIILLRDTVKVT